MALTVCVERLPCGWATDGDQCFRTLMKNTAVFIMMNIDEEQKTKK